MTSRTDNEAKELAQNNLQVIDLAVKLLWKSANFRKYFTKRIGGYDDAKSIATIVYYRTCQLYDSSKGNFRTYAINSIKRNLWKTCNAEGVIKTPGYSKQDKISKESRDLSDKAHHTFQSISLFTEEIEKIDPQSEEKSSSSVEIEDNEALLGALRQLSEEQQKIISMYYGIGRGKVALYQIGAEINKDTSYVRRVLRRTHIDLKHLVTEINNYNN